MLAGPAGMWECLAERARERTKYLVPSNTQLGRAMPGEQDQGSRGLHPHQASSEDKHPAQAVLGYRHVGTRGTPNQGHEKKGTSGPNASWFPAMAASPEKNPLFSPPHLLPGAREGSRLP